MAQVGHGILQETVFFCVYRDETHVIELVRSLEEHSAAMLRLALRRERRPGGIARRLFEVLLVRRLVLEPLGNLAGELQLVVDPFRTVALQLLGLHLVQSSALHELALHQVQRRERVVPLGERARLGLDAEELREKILYVRRQRHEEIRLVLRSGRISPRGKQPIAQRHVGLAEEGKEGRVDAQQAAAFVQVLEPDVESKLHEGRIISESSLLPQRITLFPSGVFHADQEQRVPRHRRRIGPRRSQRAHGSGERREGGDRRHAGGCGREARARARRPLRQDRRYQRGRRQSGGGAGAQGVRRLACARQLRRDRARRAHARQGNAARSCALHARDTDQPYRHLQHDPARRRRDGQGRAERLGRARRDRQYRLGGGV